MIHNEPKCPYCGTGMILERRCSMGMFYHCPNLKCLSASPYVRRKDGEDTKALCYEAALRRPLQKPLTLREFHEMAENFTEEAVVYCESKEDPQTYANILYGGRIIDREADSVHAYMLVYKNYGKTWRAWATRPTDEERAAAPWEE